MNTITTVLHFQNTYFDITDIHGEPWLRLGQIGLALGYSNPADLQKVYNRNSDEFDDNMTQVIELDTNGGKQPTRIFSLRGCHLLGMLAKTETAKAFRRWVLDVLQEYTTRAKAEEAAKVHGWQAAELGAAARRLAERTAEPPQSVYARLFRQFSVRDTAGIPRRRFQEALDFLADPAPPEVWHPQLTEDDVLYLQDIGREDIRVQNIAVKNQHLINRWRLEAKKQAEVQNG